ncbi:aminoglycoside phosphotransferase family protein [Streptacidiphilus sp. ASG 303]|uniref:aminoglycoside phosphotransferase family protein n=1 Tax=Streptacidiphilus sp. ASG 303 TaxID=2896847 RepID=UPI001E36BD47|nr:aminoglycoside phosphotransferase family protein [Streptacidiphilus sp. ASG 303]MCD0485067.1 aminoglycoside phosphotransferase family protein [Streptacidiphilus sp. ASG 303]
MSRATYTEPAGAGPEVPLPGGDVTEGVVRVGATVRRPVGPNAPLVHALLRHLEHVGFPGAPRFLGIDAAGREVLTFVPGEVAGRPKPAWVADETRLASVGRLLRAHDDAAAGFVLPDGVRPSQGFTAPPDMPPAPPYPADLVGHMDVTPDNVVFRGGEAVALIDFDLARPASRVDEVHNAMLHWAPLGDPADADPPLQGVDVPRRCRILADAYGMSDTDRSRLVEVAVLRARRSWFSMRQAAEELGGGWARMWQEGAGDRIRRREAWLERNGPAVEAALTAP